MIIAKVLFLLVTHACITSWKGGVRFTYQSPSDRPFTVYASLGYEYDRMKTEETNICDLYFSKTHTLLPSVMLNWKPAESWKFSWWLEGRIDLRKGYENIFERYQSDVENNIYDYRMVDTQQNYKMNKMYLLTQVRAQYHFNGNQEFRLTGGVAMNNHEETYHDTMYEIKNASLFPHGKADQSTAPSLSVTPDKHDETWGSATLFFLF